MIGSVTPEFVVTTACHKDQTDWLRLWRHYQLSVPDAVDGLTWSRIVDPAAPISCLIARQPDGSAVGFANYVVYPTTWDDRLVCYLQDLFVVPSARGRGAGRQLLDALVDEGIRQRWCRIDVITAADNDEAQRLYIRVGRLKEALRYEIPLPFKGP